MDTSPGDKNISKLSLRIYKDFISVENFNINRPPSAFHCNHKNTTWKGPNSFLKMLLLLNLFSKY